MHLDYGGLVTIGIGIRGRATDCLRPVSGESRDMLGVEAVAERMGDNLVGHHPTMPSVGKTAQAVVITRCLEDGLHSFMLTSGSRCSTTSASKIRFLKTTCYVSSTATSVSILCVRSCVHPTAKRGDRRLIRKCCCGSCCWGISTASAVSGSCWKNCACTGMALVHRVGVRAGDSPSLDVLEEPAWPLSGVEPVSGVV